MKRPPRKRAASPFGNRAQRVRLTADRPAEESLTPPVVPLEPLTIDGITLPKAELIRALGAWGLEVDDIAAFEDGQRFWIRFKAPSAS